jgi:hypothetical protein
MYGDVQELRLAADSNGSRPHAKAVGEMVRDSNA